MNSLDLKNLVPHNLIWYTDEYLTECYQQKKRQPRIYHIHCLVFSIGGTTKTIMSLVYNINTLCFYEAKSYHKKNCLRLYKKLIRIKVCTNKRLFLKETKLKGYSNNNN